MPLLCAKEEEDEVKTRRSRRGRQPYHCRRVSKASISRSPTRSLAHRAGYSSVLIRERIGSTFLDLLRGTSWAPFVFFGSVLPSSPSQLIVDKGGLVSAPAPRPHLHPSLRAQLATHGIGRLIVGPGGRPSPADQRKVSAPRETPLPRR